MKKYETPEAEVLLLYLSDIITISGGIDDDDDDDWWTKLY